MKCKICERRAKSELCDFHKMSLENLKKKFEEWRKAMGVSWTEYLEMVRSNPHTGVWVKEVIQYLLSKSRVEGKAGNRERSNA